MEIGQIFDVCFVFMKYLSYTIISNIIVVLMVTETILKYVIYKENNVSEAGIR